MLQFYAAGIANATAAEEVGAVIYDAVTSENPKLRYPCSWGGLAMINGRAAMSDEDWVLLGSIIDDAAYYERFQEVFGIDLTKS